MTRNQIASLATAIAAVGGVIVWQANPGVTGADFPDCQTRLVTCDWRIDDDGRAVLEDAGLSVGRGYRALATRVKVCTQEDGGRDVILPPMPQRVGALASLVSPDFGTCSIGADPGGALWRPAQSRCTRKPSDGGACSLVDGGNPGDLNAFPRARLIGAGCEDTPCGVFAGEEP